MAPVFSVVIPTFDRPAALEKCLSALTLQSYPGPFEAIVVNDGGPALPDMVLARAGSLPLLVLCQPNGGPAAARNLGARHAKGEFLAFTDDDCEPSPGWLEELSRNLENDRSAMVGGRTINACPGNSYSAASQLLVDFLYQFYLKDGLPRFFTSNNISLARQAFGELGGFDESFPLPAAEDREFCARWRNRGRHMIYSPGALIRHAHHLTAAGFLRQHFSYGRGAYQFRRRTAESGGEKIELESLSFYWHLVFHPLKSGQGGTVERWKQTMLFLVGQAANAAGFFSERWRI